MKNNIKEIILMGRKKGAVDAVKFLIKKKIKIAAIVGVESDPYSEKLLEIANKNKILFILNEEDLYDLVEKKDKRIAKIDLVISYLYSKKIKNPLIKLGRIGCINFHPAPLPDYKSSAGYNIAILEKRSNYGVSVHFIDSEDFDQGPIIKVLKFPISNRENMISLYKKTQEKLFELFQTTIVLFQSGEEIKAYENKGGLYLNRNQLEEFKNVDLGKDSPELIDRKIRAFFFPPYTGAKIKIGSQDITLVNDELLKYLDKILKK